MKSLKRMNDKVYNAPIDRLHAPERLRLLEVRRVVGLCVDDHSVKHVLDIGTGSGIFARAFINKGLSVTGIDINPEMLKTARQRVPEAQFQAGSMETLPFEDSSFDLVFMSHVLHETDDTDRALAETYRVSRSRTAILEWPFRHENYGPVLQHRLRPEQVQSHAENAGYTSISRHRLSHMDLWTLQK